MTGSRLGLLAAAALVAGLGGCSLPEVLPLAGTTSAGPSPYGPWYEQHWATNSVLLAAADQPEGGEVVTDEWGTTPEGSSEASSEASGDFMAEAEAAAAAIAAEENGPVEASAAPSSADGSDFDNSTPYQFPASDFSPPSSGTPGDAVEEPSASLPEKAPSTRPAPSASGPIRY